MLTNPHSGLFVDIEGIDGSGQSTQVTRVAEKLKKDGFKVEITRAAPMNNPIGVLIRQALNHSFQLSSIQALEFLFAADHTYRQNKEIIPVLKKSGIVISNRSVWSFVAFGSLEADTDWLFDLAKNLTMPDITFFLKVSPRAAIKRIAAYRNTRDFFERQKILEKVWKNYLSLSKKFSDKIRVIDGERPIEKVTEEIVGMIKKHPKFTQIR